MGRRAVHLGERAQRGVLGPALAGRDALEVDWEDGPRGKLTTEDIGRAIDAAVPNAGHVSRREGDVAAALAGAATRLTARPRDGS